MSERSTPLRQPSCDVERRADSSRPTAAPSPVVRMPYSNQHTPHRAESVEVVALRMQLSALQREAESKDFAIVDLRRQTTDLLNYRHEAGSLRRQLQVLDERVRARDSVQQACLNELKAKLRLHETVGGKQQSLLLKGEEERLALQRATGERIELAARRFEEEAGRAQQAEAHAQRCAAEAQRWQTELMEERAGAQQQEARARELQELNDELSEKLARAEGELTASEAKAGELRAAARARE